MLKKVVEKFAMFIFVYIFVRSIRHNNKTKRYEKFKIYRLREKSIKKLLTF
jgi:hypothetical protein